jgi:hypothetical protein
MSLSRRQCTIGARLSLAVLASRGEAQQAVVWPTRTVRIVVAYVPGGALDTFARMFAERLSGTWGSQLWSKTSLVLRERWARSWLGLELLIMNASSERDIDAAFASFVQQRVNAIILGVDQFLFNRRNQLVELKRSAYLLID